MFWVFLLQRKSYLVSFERLYHLYPFIYPKYKHNKSIKAEQIPYFSFFIEKRVSGHISSSNVTKFWTRKIWFDSKTGNFQFEIDTFHIFLFENERFQYDNFEFDPYFDLKLTLKSIIRIGFRFGPNYGKMSGFPIIWLRRHLIEWSLNLNYDRLNWNRLFNHVTGLRLELRVLQ